MSNGKSLTEAAKEILTGQGLQEGIPAIGPVTGGVSNPNPVDGSTVSTGNAKTLRPGSGNVDPRHANPGAPDPSSFDGADDLDGATPTEVPDENLGAKAAAKVGKDTSRSAASKVAAEPIKKLAEDEEMSLAERIKALKEARKCASSMEEMKEKGEKEEMDEDLELSEDLEDFIAGAIEAGLNEEEILHAIDENFEFVSEDTEEFVSEEEQALADYQIDMSEHVNALLAGEDLSEEFHVKATTIFEAAVKAKLEEEVSLLEQAYAETLEERVAQIEEELSNQVDDYLNYVVEQWIEENEVAVESALRSELTEDFISGLRALFAEHYIDVPEEEVPVVEELSSTVEELEARLNEEIQRNVELTSALNESRKVELTSYVCEGLTSTQAEKLKALAENVSFTSDEEYIEKIATLRENYFATSAKNDQVLDRVEIANDPSVINESSLEGPMANYVKAIGKTML